MQNTFGICLLIPLSIQACYFRAAKNLHFSNNSSVFISKNGVLPIFSLGIRQPEPRPRLPQVPDARVRVRSCKASHHRCQRRADQQPVRPELRSTPRVIEQSCATTPNLGQDDGISSLIVIPIEEECIKSVIVVICASVALRVECTKLEGSVCVANYDTWSFEIATRVEIGRAESVRRGLIAAFEFPT